SQELEGDSSHSERCLLDVGCGYGDFLETAKERGWRTLGIEIDTTMHRHCLERGLEVENRPLQESSIGKGTVDVAVYWNVLDSIPDPRREMETLSTLLKPGGQVWLRLPNGGFHGRLLRLFGRFPQLLEGFVRLEWTPLNAWLFT